MIFSKLKGQKKVERKNQNEIRSDARKSLQWSSKQDYILYVRCE